MNLRHSDKNASFVLAGAHDLLLAIITSAILCDAAFGGCLSVRFLPMCIIVSATPSTPFGNAFSTPSQSLTLCLDPGP